MPSQDKISSVLEVLDGGYVASMEDVTLPVKDYDGVGIFNGMIILHRIFHRNKHRVKLLLQCVGCLDHLLYDLVQTAAQLLNCPR